MFYGASFEELFQRSADYVDKILRQTCRSAGRTGTKFDLVINLKTAKSLGLDIPAPILARTDVVIE